MSERLDRSEEVFARLFGPRDASAPDKDPESGRILRTLIFGEVLATGDLDDRIRELITCTCLAALQTLPQLRAHLGAALRVGVEPVQLREALYQLAPFAGFPRTLNAVAVLDEVLEAHGVELPLPEQGTTTDEDRLARGRELQEELYGTAVREALAGLPGGFDEAVPDFLSAHLFGDVMTRNGLDRPTRELLGLCTLVALNQTAQFPSHIRATIRAGHSVETVLAALVQCFPYVGIPIVVTAIREVKAVTD